MGFQTWDLSYFILCTINTLVQIKIKLHSSVTPELWAVYLYIYYILYTNRIFKYKLSHTKENGWKMFFLVTHDNFWLFCHFEKIMLWSVPLKVRRHLIIYNAAGLGGSDKSGGEVRSKVKKLWKPRKDWIEVEATWIRRCGMECCCCCWTSFPESSINKKWIHSQYGRRGDWSEFEFKSERRLGLMAFSSESSRHAKNF